MNRQNGFLVEEPPRKPPPKPKPEPRRVDTCHCQEPFMVDDSDGDEWCFRCGLPEVDE